MAVESTMLPLGTQAPDFRLTDTVSGAVVGLEELTGRALVVMFICNHCPYVLAVLDRIVEDARELQQNGIGVAAICSNDADAYPADGFDRMAELAHARDFPFPYLHDADQSVARAWGAVCTPDFFGFDTDLGLQYRGRLDASRKEAGPSDLRRDLFEAMRGVAETGQGPREQVPSMGCSIKWAAA